MKKEGGSRRENFDIIIAGVGGQGNIFASRVLADAAIQEGYHVTIGETFGMSQRGGSVASHLRLADKIYGPLIPDAGADLIIGLEPLEALRCATVYLKLGGVIVTNSHAVLPSEGSYPDIDQVFEFSKKVAGKLFTLDAGKLAKEAGDILSSNIVVIGAAYGSGVLPVKEEQLKNALRERLPRTADLNTRAFDLGKRAVKRA